MIAIENYRFDDYLNTIGADLNAVGDEPVAFDWIGGQIFNGVQMTGIHSLATITGLNIGDYVNLVSNNPRYTGKFKITAIGDDTDPAWAESVFCIGVVKQADEIASGTWQRTIACTIDQTLTNGVCVENKKGIIIGGKTFTYAQIAGFLFSLVLVSMALAFPLKSIKEITKNYSHDSISKK